MLKNARNLIPLTKDVLNNVNRPLIAPYCSPGYFSSGQKVGNVLYKWWFDPRRFKHRHDAPEEVPCIIYKYIHI